VNVATLQELEARLTRLEARAATPAPTPLAAVPPIRIGEITDVPTPGSPIASAWSQEVTNRITQRFAPVAARYSQWPAATAGNGAVCVTLDTYTRWLSNGTVWRTDHNGVLNSQTFAVGDTNWAGGALRDVLFGNYTPPMACTIAVTGVAYFGFAGAAISGAVELVRLSDGVVVATGAHLTAPAGLFALGVVNGAWTGAAGVESGFKIRVNTAAGSQYYNATANLLATAN
jgi:hypothetical protein